MKFELYVIFTCHKIAFFDVFKPNKNVKMLLLFWIYENR